MMPQIVLLNCIHVLWQSAPLQTAKRSEQDLFNRILNAQSSAAIHLHSTLNSIFHSFRTWAYSDKIEIYNQNQSQWMLPAPRKLIKVKNSS